MPERAGETPGWLLSGEVGLCPCGCIGVRRRASFVEKTLTGGSQVLRQTMFSEDLAARDGLLQRADPRAKLLGMLLLLVVAGLAHHVPVLAVMYAGLLVLAAASRVPLGFFLKRVWFFVPLFTLVIVAPATLSVVNHGDVVVQLWSWHGHPEGLTAQGLQSALLVVSRVAVSISVVVLVTVTTPWTRLLAGLRALGVPRFFVLVIGMAYRYLFTLLETVTDMFTARKARTVGRVRHDAASRRFVGASAGAMIGKANQLSEEVHQAMVARGYRGDARVLDELRVRAADMVLLLAVAVVAAGLLTGDHLLGH